MDTDRTSFQLMLIPHPAIYKSTVIVHQSQLASPEQKTTHSQSQMRFRRRYKLIQKGARIITILPE